MTLYEELGGFRAIRAVVDEFYDRVFADAYLDPFFSAARMSRQRHRVAAF